MRQPRSPQTLPTDEIELELARRLDEEHRALEESLREYLDQRLSRLSRTPGEAAAHRPRGRDRWGWRGDAYFVVTLVFLGLLWWRVEGLRGPALREPAATPPSAASAAQPATPAGTGAGESPPVSAAPEEQTAPASAAAIDLDDPAARWESFVGSEAAKVASWARAISEHRGLAANRVSTLQKSNSARWAATLEEGGSLSEAQRDYLRLGLFEYVYGRWLSERATPPPGDPGSGWDKVDLVINDGEYSPAALAALLAELGLSARFAAPDPKDPALQVAVLVTWIGSRPSSEPRGAD